MRGPIGAEGARIGAAARYGVEAPRSEAKAPFLRDAGADHVVIDDGALAGKMRDRFGAGVDRVLELVGATTLRDSLASVAPRGIVCVTGILGGAWVVDRFEPMEDIPTGVKLTSYSGRSEDITADELSRYIRMVEEGRLKLTLGPTFPFGAVVDAHRAMDANSANGKIVIVV
jgi:NADPH:quinone reductase-like Zn-dependent oxidoreductase